jgi:hypothetical protein
MTRVIAVGYDEQALLPQPPLLPAFPHSLHRDDLGRLLALIEVELARGQEVVTIAPRWLAGPAVTRLQTVRAALDTTRLALYTSPLPPLAGAVLCALAAALGERVHDAGLLHAALPALERDLLPMARLGSVVRLAHPVPSLGQRALSLWPGTGFGVSWWPRPHLRTLRIADDGVALPSGPLWDGPPVGRIAVAAPDRTALDWVEEAVLPAFGDATVVRVDQPPFTALYWGSRRVIEVVAYPTDLPALLRRVTGERARRCPWCGATVATTTCPFCELTPVRAFAVPRQGAS